MSPPCIWLVLVSHKNRDQHNFHWTFIFCAHERKLVLPGTKHVQWGLPGTNSCTALQHVNGCKLIPFIVQVHALCSCFPWNRVISWVRYRVHKFIPAT